MYYVIVIIHVLVKAAFGVGVFIICYLTGNGILCVTCGVGCDCILGAKNMRCYIVVAYLGMLLPSSINVGMLQCQINEWVNELNSSSIIESARKIYKCYA